MYLRRTLLFIKLREQCAVPLYLKNDALYNMYTCANIINVLLFIVCTVYKGTK